jgi:hypothetical protein
VAALASELGVLTACASQEVLAAQRRLGLDPAEVNADGTAGLPMPTAVLIDSEHRVRWIDVHPDHATRTEVATSSTRCRARFSRARLSRDHADSAAGSGLGSRGRVEVSARPARPRAPRPGPHR